MTIDIHSTLISIDFQIISIDWYWLIFVIIDFIDYWFPMIDIAGNKLD